MASFLQNLEAHLDLIPGLLNAVKGFQAIGSSKESTLSKVVQIVEQTAAIGETVPVPVVQLISGTVESIVEEIFGNAAPTPANPPA
jgi:hypothetical protein